MKAKMQTVKIRFNSIDPLSALRGCRAALKGPAMKPARDAISRAIDIMEIGQRVRPFHRWGKPKQKKFAESANGRTH